MKEIIAGLFGAVILLIGYYLGHFHGWVSGYDKALKDVKREVDEYERRLLNEVKKEK